MKGNFENKTSSMIKLNSFIDTYLYISRNIDPEILRYLNETEEAVSFYYSVENILEETKKGPLFEPKFIFYKSFCF